MAATGDSSGLFAARPADRAARLTLGVAIAVLAAFQIHLAATMSVNWDEFHYLAQIHAYARGDLGRAVNSIHVHAFQWLRAIPGGEINQIVAGRFVMLALEAATVFFIMRIARRFLSLEAALAAAVVYLSVGFVLAHGASFRTDPIITALLMGALWLVICSPLKLAQTVIVGVLVAIAALINIKSVFYVPPLALAALWRLRTAEAPGRTFTALAVGGLAGCVTLAGLYLLHRASLTAPQVSDAVAAQGAWRKTVLAGDFFPRWTSFTHSASTNALQWLLIAGGVGMAAWGTVRERRDRWRWAVLLGLAAPLASLLFYRNAFPYYYAVILPGACVLAGLPLERWRGRAALIGVGVASVIIAGLQYAAYVQRDQHPQRAVIAAVHQMFAQPVPYIERAEMIGSFPDAGFFMTTWGMERYADNARPVLRERAETRPPAFVIAGHPALIAALEGEQLPDDWISLLPADAAFLRQNFIAHWGAIWVAGKRFEAAGGETTFDILIPGPYTLEAPAAAVIDGAERRPGEVFQLSRGAHTLSAATPVTLRWGDHLPHPTEPPPEGFLYWGF